jgi:uncharacterized protein (TIGR00369 family)
MTTHGQQVGESATTGASAADAPNPDFGEAVRLALATMPAAQDLGVVVEALEPGEATLVLPVRESHTQHTGHVQAGVLGALADFAAGAAVGTLLPAGWANVTLDFHVKIVAAASGPQLTARGSAVSARRTVSVARTEICDSEGRICATALATFRNIRVSS